MKTRLQLLTARNCFSFIGKAILIFVITALSSTHVWADVIITPATSGTSISADRAANASSPSFTILGDIVITESQAHDIANTGGAAKTFILTAPAGWTFNPAAGTVAATGADISSISLSVTTTEIIITMDVTGTSTNDVITISGIEVQAADGAVIPSTGNIYNASANPGTATIEDITTTNNTSGSGGTNFGSLSQKTGDAANLVFTTEPAFAAIATIFGQQPVVITEDQFGNASTEGLGASKNVTITLSAGNGILSGTTILDIGTAAGNGTVIFTDLQISAAGVKKLMANAPGLTFAVTNDFLIDQATSTTTLSANINPSCFGDNVTLTATILPGVATGTVTFFDGVTSLGTTAISGGTAALVISSLSVGSHSITAVYSGDSDYLTSTSAAITQDVNPAAPATPGPITGTAAVCPATTGIVYSISVVANATTYTWNVPAGWNITSGAGTNSITVTAGTFGQNGNISVTAGNSCGTSEATVYAVSVNPAIPSTPGSITGSAAVCPATTGNVYSISSVADATTYTWNVPAGWNITSGAGTTSITVTAGTFGQDGNISVTAGNSCGTSTAAQLAVTVNPATPASPGAISGAATVCPATAGNVYSVSAVANATSYNWTVPAGWSITAGAGTISITVTAGSFGQNGNISVNATNSCGTSGVSTFAVTVNPAAPATPGVITGPSPVCPNTAGFVYSIAAVANATSYNWNVPVGWTITAGAGTTSITVTSGAAAGNITVASVNSCGTSSQQTKAITLNPAVPAIPGTISGAAAVCPATTGNGYSISPVANATTYTWVVPAGWSITSGSGTTSISVTAGAAGQNGNITVTAGNGCGTSSAQTKAVVVSPGTPATPGTITGPSPVCPNATGIVYSVAAVANATSYNWVLPAGWSVTAGAGTNSITVTTGAAGGNITVAAVNSCGVSDAVKTININPVVAANNSGWTDNNGPKTPDLITVNSGFGERRGYIKFPLSGIPAGSTINSAILRLTNNGSTASGAINFINALDNNDPVPTAAATLFNAAGNGTTYHTGTWANTGQISLTLNATANTDIQNRVSVPGWLGVGVERGGTGLFNFYGYSAGANAPVLTVSYASVRSVAITMNPPVPATPGVITGTAAVCPATTGIVYSIVAVANATTYTWVVPAGWTITAGQGTTSITATAGNAGDNGNITVTAGNSCGTSGIRTLGVTVNPRPTVSATPASQTRCSGSPIGNITITNPNNVPGTTFNWTRTNTGNLTGIAASGTGSTISGTLNNSTGSQQTTTFTLTAAAGSCSSTTTVTVIVNPLPAANAGGNQTLCTTLSSTVLGATTPATGGTGPYTYTWSPATGLSAVNAANPVATPPSYPYVYSLIVTDANGCNSPASNVTISQGPVTKTWNGDGVSGGTGDNNFNNPQNWLPKGVPSDCNDVVMNVDFVSFIFGTVSNIDFNNNVTIKSLTTQLSGFQILNFTPTIFRLNVGSNSLNILNNTSLTTNCTGFPVSNSITQVSVANTGVVTYGGNLTTTGTETTNQVMPFYASTNNTGKFYVKGNAALGNIGNDPANKPSKVIFDGTGTQTITHNSGTQPIYLGVTSTEVGETNSPVVVLAGAGTGGFRNFGDLNVNSNATLDVAQQLINRNSAGGSINLAAGSIMKIGRNSGGIGTSNFPSNYSTYNFNATSTVEYNGALAQTVHHLPLYGNITLSNTANKNPTGNITAQKNINIAGSAVLIGGTRTITLGGNWTSYSQAGFLEQNSIVDFNSTGPQTINTTNGEIFFDLRKTASGTLTQLSDVSVQGTGATALTISAGVYDAGTFSLNSPASAFNMSAGLLKMARLNTTLPEFNIAAYNITGGTIELYGSGNQALRGARAYRNLTFSVSGTKTVTAATPSITGTILTKDAAILDVSTNVMGGAGTNLTMTGTSLYRTAGTGTKPDALGVYSLGTGTTVEFSSSDPLNTEDIRLTEPVYFNLSVTGNNVANPTTATGIRIQSGGTFTVRNGGVFKLGNSNGFSGGMTTAIEQTNSPAIVLEQGSTVEYYGGPAGTNNQTITNALDYQGLTFSGSSVKTAPSGTLTVKGNLSNLGSGFNHNSGIVLLNGTALQQYNSTGTPLSYHQFHIGNPVNVNINAGLAVEKQLSLLTAGKLNMVSGDITMRSTATHTANVDKILTNDAITYGTGRFIVERYIATGANPGQHSKSWQLLAVPVNTTQTVKDAWQEGALTPNGNPNPGYGTQLTSNVSGATSPAIGFDVFTAPGPSIKTYNSAMNAWDGLANTTSLSITNKKGYMVFVRGDRSVTAFNQPANATILRARGKLYAPATLAADAPPSTTVLPSKFETVGNPYASAIDFSLISKTGDVDAKYYVWDPLLTSNYYGLGGYQTISQANGWKPIPGGTANYDENTAYQLVQSGQAFFVYSTGAGGTVSFTEASKVTDHNMVFRAPDNNASGLDDRQYFRAQLLAGSGSNAPLADGNAVAIDDEFSNGQDADDALKIANTGENFGVARYGKTLSLETRKKVINTDTIYYQLSNLRRQAYQLHFKPEHMAVTGMEARLVDKFLGNSTSVSLSSNTLVDFTVTTDPASAAADRFYVVFKAFRPVPVTITSVSANRNSDATVTVNWKSENETSMQQYEVERSGDGRNFISIGTAAPKVNNGGNAGYTYQDVNPFTGNNYYRIKAVSQNGLIQLSNIVKVLPVKTAGTITVYPNPVVDKIANIRFSNMEAGTYQIRLINNLGQVADQSSILIHSASESKALKIARGIPSGNYQMSIVSPDGKESVQQLFIQ